MAFREPAVLLAALAEGDATAFPELVERYKRLVWAVIRNHGIGGADAEDVFQLAFVRLYEHRDRIVQPERLAGWMTTVSRNECLAAQRRRGRTTSLEALELDLADPDVDATADLVAGEEHRAYLAAFESLGEQCRQLLRLLSADPRLSYEEIRDAMGYPSTGNIGPTRRRCLRQLREHPAVRALVP
jgi:RNA polymerase sigma factor (sigma-70 family)